MKKVLSLVLVMSLMLVFCLPAQASGISKTAEPEYSTRDGFSWGHSYTDPSGGLGYYVTGSWTNGTTILPKALGSIGTSVLTNTILTKVGWSLVATNVASAVVAGLVFVADIYLSSTTLYYKERISENSVLPTWYQKCEYIWYYDSARTLEAARTTFYRFRA